MRDVIDKNETGNRNIEHKPKIYFRKRRGREE